MEKYEVIELEEDYIVTAECSTCGYVFDYCEDFEDISCPNCESDEITYESAHCGIPCNICNRYFDSEERAYTARKKGSMEEVLICELCGEPIKEEQERRVDKSHLIDWYITSVVGSSDWTEEMIDELLKDFDVYYRE